MKKWKDMRVQFKEEKSNFSMFQTGNNDKPIIVIIFSSVSLKICCGCSKEPSH